MHTTIEEILQSTPRKKSYARYIALLLLLIATAGTYFTYTRGVLLAYNDATAHLNTARRIIDSLTPGFVQIGSVWLPLLHILELPFVANYFLWQSGLAGSIISGISFVVGGVFLYKLIAYVTKSFWAGLLGILVYASNVNLLYLQSTPMFEPLLIATAMGSIYFLARWSLEDDEKYLIFASFFTMLATLTRYDGWALFLTTAAFVFLRSLKKGKGWDGPVILYLSLAGFGIVLWLVYNWLIFGDPLFFSRGEFSAAAQQDVLYLHNALPTKNNLPLSITTYSLSTLLNIGAVTTGLGIWGLLSYLKNNSTSIRKYVPLLLLTPYVFNIATLYLGQSVIWLPMVPPYFTTYFNARYGVLMIPAVAFFAGYVSSKNILFKAIIILGTMAQIYLFMNPAVLPLFGRQIGVITLQDTVSSVNDDTKHASTFLHDHYKDGLILASSASSDAFIFRAGIPLKNFITEGSGHYWKESLKDPSVYPTWIVFFRDHTDRVGKEIYLSPKLTKNFTELYHDDTYRIWKRNTPEN
jgi:hypothetical protein